MDGTKRQSDSVEEVTFTVSDPTYPFVGVSKAESCEVELERMVPREPGHYAEFFNVIGADPDRVLDLAEKHEHVDPDLLVRREDGGLFEFVVSSGCPARHLAELGALPQKVESTDGNGRIVAEVLPGYDVSDVIEGFLTEHSSAELTGKHTKEHRTPLFTERELQRAIDTCLTDRQQEVLRTAYEGGYYQRPREKTGREIATELGISSATFSQHVRAAERTLLSILYDDSAI